MEPINVHERSKDSISMIPPFGTDETARAGAFTEWPIVHAIDDIAAVHPAMEPGETTGKVVVVR